MKNKPILILDNKRPFFHSVLSASAFTLCLLFLIMFFFGENLLDSSHTYQKYQVKVLYFAILLASAGIYYGRTKNIFIDITRSRILNQWQVGPFKMGKWQKMGDINYVSVFEATKSNGTKVFEVYLWFTDNKRRVLSQFAEPSAALSLGQTIAKKLRTDFLDATNPHDKRWIKFQES